MKKLRIVGVMAFLLLLFYLLKVMRMRSKIIALGIVLVLLASGVNSGEFHNECEK